MSKYDHLTPAQKSALLNLAHQIDAAKAIPGGSQFVVDLLLAHATKAGLTVVDAGLVADLTASVDRLSDLLKQWCGDPETETGWKSDELAAVYIEAVDLLRKARGESA